MPNLHFLTVRAVLPPAAVLFVLVLVAIRPDLLAQAPRFEVGVTNIGVDVSVRDGARIVRGLSRADFVVSDEGQQVDVVAFEEESIPLDLAILLDLSGSMHRDLAEMASVADRALAQLKPVDRVAVLKFSWDAHLEQPLTHDKALAAATIRQVMSRGNLDVTGTVLIRPIATTIRTLDKGPESSTESPRRRAILVVTDNFFQSDAPPDDEIIAALLRADITLHAIVIHRKHIGETKPPPRDDPNGPRYTRENVFHIAAATGGDALVSAKAKESLPEMLSRIRARYSLWYHAPEVQHGVFRRIKVVLTEDASRRYPGAVVRAREGYYPISLRSNPRAPVP